MSHTSGADPTTSRFLGSEERKSQLLAAARLVFAEKGYKATKISDIVERAGIAQGTFYIHFFSKEALVSELLSLPVKELTAASRQKSDPVALEEIVIAAFRVAERYRDLCRLVYITDERLENPSALDELAGIIQSAMERRGRSSADSEVLARLFLSVLRTAIFEAFSVDDSHRFDSIRAATARMLSVGFG
jgi:AcrR family transcriptional regulator